MAGDIRMKEPRTQRTEQVNTAQQDHSANYLFLIIGTPLVAFLIAASAMLESRGFPVPLVRIGTGAAGLILQAIPFMLLGAMMSAVVSTFVSTDSLARHIPKSLAGGLAAALAAGLCLPVCDCMVVPTFANLMRKRLPLPCAVTFLCAVPVMNPMAIWSTWFAFTDKSWMVAARMGLGMVVAIVAGVSFAVWPLRSPAVRERPLTIGRSLICEDCAGATGDSPESHPPVGLCRQPRRRGTGRGLERFTHFIRHTHDDFMRMMPILLFGTIIASIMRTALSSLTNGSSTLDDAGAIVLILAAMGLAFLCSLCSTSDAVIAASMIGALPVSAMLAFLVFGPMLDLKNTLMLATECRPRFIIRFIATVAAACFLAAIAAHLVMGA